MILRRNLALLLRSSCTRLNGDQCCDTSEGRPRVLIKGSPLLQDGDS